MNREFLTPLSQHVSGEVNNHRGLSLTLKGPLISHPSTMVPTYPSTISRSYGAGGAGRVPRGTESLS